MYLQPSKAILKDWQFWPVITITHFKLMEDDWTYVKFVKMDDRIVELLQQVEIPIPEDFFNPIIIADELT